MPATAGPGPDPATGWAVVDLLDAAAVAELRAIADARPEVLAAPFHATSAQSPRADAVAVDHAIKQVVGPALQALLPGYRPFLAAIISKAATTGGEVAFHQDWTYTDERTHRAVLVWIPLVDVDASSGALRAVSGSHRASDGIRPSGTPLATDGLQDHFAERSTTVAMRAGQAFVYDPALVHGSWPNTAHRPRPVAAVALAPEGATLVHFSGADGTLRGAIVDGSWFTTCEFADLPDDATPYEAWTGTVTPDELVG